jgi:phage shock protein E
MRFSSNKIIVTLLMAVALGLARLLSVPAAAESDLGRLPDTVDIVTVRALQGREDVVLIDVREPEEYQAGHIPGITLIPRGQVPSRLAEIPKDKTVILTCRSGNRSSQVADLLRQQGYTAVHNMKGGLQAWQAAGYPVEK